MFKRLKTFLLPVAILAAVFGGVSVNAATLPETRVGGYQLFDAASRQAETPQVPESQQANAFSWYDTASECSVAAKSGVQANKIAGDAFRDEIAHGLKMEGRDVATEVYKRTPFGKRYIDVEVSLEGKVLGGVETKVGGSRYTPLQRVKDTWLRLVEDYPVNVVRDR